MSRPTDGIVRRWTDAWGRPRRVPPRTVAAVRAAMGLDDGPAPSGARVLLVRPGQRLPASGEVVLEDGTSLGTCTRLPDDLPWGYHRLLTDEERLLIAAPSGSPLPERAWGWAAQLYATRSRGSWGIGDLADLRELARWSAAAGAGFLLVSPMGAPNPAPDPEPSPYFPGTRRFRDPLLLRVEEAPGADLARERVAALGLLGRGLNVDRLIDRRRALALKREALQALWDAGAGALPEARRGVRSLDAEIGPSLRRWAVFATLSEELGSDWRTWPEAYRSINGGAVRRFAGASADRVAFHAWVQWLLDEQLRQASQPLRLIADLPVGFDPGGFDAWEWQDATAGTATIGAPPDLFNLVGQDWGLPPFIPHRLLQAGLRPFIDTLRAVLRHAGGVRIDHVLGLFRLWWVPGGASAAEGAYVRYPVDELLAMLAIEATRAGACVIGEDLGTIEAGVRETLAAHDLLSMRLVFFEEVRPARYPRRTFAAATTHDLPTLAGTWTGSDLGDLERSGIAPDAEQLAGLRRSVAHVAGVGEDASVEEAIIGTYRALAGAPSRLIVATLEDAARVEERPNVPATGRDQRPNWSLALPQPLEDLERDPFVAELAAALQR